MKKQLTILAVLLGCIIFSGCEKKERFTVTGRLESYIEGFIPEPTLITIPDLKKTRNPLVKDELFQFHGKIGAPEIAVVNFNDEVSHWTIVLEPGNIVLDRFQNCGRGTPLNDALFEGENLISKLTVKQSETLVEDLKGGYLEIIDNHLDDILGTYYLTQCFGLLSKEEIDSILAKAGPGFKKNKLYRPLMSDIRKNLKAVAKNAAAENEQN